MWEFLTSVLKSNGIVGLLILAPMAALVFVWGELRRVNKKYEDVQERRIEEAQEISTKIMELVSEQSSQSKETLIALDRVGTTLTVVQAALTGGQVAYLKERFNDRLPKEDQDPKWRREGSSTD